MASLLGSSSVGPSVGMGEGGPDSSAPGLPMGPMSAADLLKDYVPPILPPNEQSEHPCVFPVPLAPNVNKDWHQEVTKNLRLHMAGKLAKALFPSPDPSGIEDQKIREFISYARKVEKETFEKANDRKDYYHLLAERLYKIQKEVQERKKSRLRTDGESSVLSDLPHIDMPEPSNVNLTPSSMDCLGCTRNTRCEDCAEDTARSESVEEDVSDMSFDGSFCSDTSVEPSEACLDSEYLFVDGQGAEEAQDSEEDRQAPEEDRQASEEDRQATEKDRQDSEDDCQASEEDRQASQEDRLAPEEDPQASEADRQVSEEDRLAPEEDLQATEEDRQPSEIDRHNYKLTTAEDWERSNNQYIAGILEEKFRLADSLMDANDKLLAWESYWYRNHPMPTPPESSTNSSEPIQQQELCHVQIEKLKTRNKNLRKYAATIRRDLKILLIAVSLFLAYSYTLVFWPKSSAPSGALLNTYINQSLYDRINSLPYKGNISEKIEQMMNSHAEMEQKMQQIKLMIKSDIYEQKVDDKAKSKRESEDRPSLASRLHPIRETYNEGTIDTEELPETESMKKLNEFFDALRREHVKKMMKADPNLSADEAEYYAENNISI